MQLINSTSNKQNLDLSDYQTCSLKKIAIILNIEYKLMLFIKLSKKNKVINFIDIFSTVDNYLPELSWFLE